ncbi:RNA recognition motif domain-containing protein [Mucilaginibacter sp. FT3.2]|uniref:RNA recognition motif domain-containing protein n=1 Tax=Mucilaginibacter sp. FT3.2 TaxID=2723090 RepID=UPI001613C772|nr:RNA-binding protein [Mucilaginibacter sp. FT3.2]MBB6234588.1 RNA recognition motif-containing protein [Mucilaginibacter sp. FT3.2]
MVKLFVGGFPLDMTELDLVKIINLHGEVSTIKIVRDKKTRICKGYAFLEMKDREGAENAVIALDGTPMGDRTLNVKINEETFVKKAPPKRSFGGYNNSYSNSGNSNTGNTSRSYSKPADETAKPKRPRRAI